MLIKFQELEIDQTKTLNSILVKGKYTTSTWLLNFEDEPAANNVLTDPFFIS